MLAERHVGPLDLLVSDITMPRLQGPELARRLSKSRPGIGVLLISGYAEAAARSELAGFHFLEKPYSQARLANAVREALARRG
jgi:FixJ family two-component response regulator